MHASHSSTLLNVSGMCLKPTVTTSGNLTSVLVLLDVADRGIVSCRCIKERNPVVTRITHMMPMSRSRAVIMITVHGFHSETQSQYDQEGLCGQSVLRADRSVWHLPFAADDI
nr:hypothetical protein CFP56_30700 [Quercus suber]